MIPFEQSKTKENLARTFAAECMDGAKYQFLAMTAKEAGLLDLESKLKTQAKHEMGHARVFYDLIIQHSGGNDVKNIDIKLGYEFPKIDLNTMLGKVAMTEFSEQDNIYPSFARVAKDEGYADVAEAFTLIAGVENCHFMLLKELHELVTKGKAYKKPAAIKWKCSLCGLEITQKEAPKKCPGCTGGQGAFIIPVSSN